MEYIKSIIFFLVLVVIPLPFAHADGEQEVVLRTVLLERDTQIEGVISGSEKLKKERFKARNFEFKFDKQSPLEISKFKDRSLKEEFLHFHLGSIRFQIKTNGEWIRWFHKPGQQAKQGGDYDKTVKRIIS